MKAAEVDNTTELDTDFLTEVANIGTGNAATALSELLNSQVHMGLPKVVEQPLANMGTLVSAVAVKPELVKVGVRGDVRGTLCIIFEEPSHYGEILGISGEMLQSAFAEVSNIMCARFLIAISQTLDIFTEVTPPEGSSLSRGAVVQELIELAENNDPFIALRADLKLEGIDSSASLLFFPTSDSIDQLKKSL